tara:strand:- start:983 stop:1165 length:183 start_codon:yes stop_codon:yes gene_type:complete
LHNRIWSEAFGGGDFDHNRLTQELVDLGISPFVTMEQAVEEKSPNTMNGPQAHEISHANA